MLYILVVCRILWGLVGGWVGGWVEMVEMLHPPTPNNNNLALKTQDARVKWPL